MRDIDAPTSIPGELQDLFRDARSHRPNLVWNYAAKGWLRRGETSVLFGPSNCGKSALVCYLGHCITSGTPFFEARVKKGVVVHVGAEAPEAVLDRMKAFDLDGVQDPAPYIVRMQPVDLSQPSEVDSFISELAKLLEHTGQKIVLIIFDTLARSIGLTDENCSTSMTGIANAAERIARTIKAHVMLVHHTGKDADRGGRGSSALRGAVDTEISLSPLKAGGVVLAQEKQRTMQKSEPKYFGTKSFVLGLDEDGEDRTTVQAVELDAPSAPLKDQTGGATAKYDTAVLTALHLRRMSSKTALAPFRPRDILDSVPPELFGSMSPENRLGTIRRVLGKFAELRSPVVEKSNGEWRLIPKR